MNGDFFRARHPLRAASGTYTIYRLDALHKAGLVELDRLPFSIRVLLESLLRQVDGRRITKEDVVALAGWRPSMERPPEVPYLPARVVMQDFTGVPAIVDLTAMRAALARLGGDPKRINPLTPVDLVIDHSVQVDVSASPQALQRNAEIEFQRNRERYEFLRWAQEAYDNFRVVPPATGIVHQVNLEYLAPVVQSHKQDGLRLAFPDTLVGMDSHTTMINALGVLGWGVGGIEAEAAMLGYPLVMTAPEVVGFRLSGHLPEGTNATDLVLTITQQLRQFGVVGKFVEFFGPGLTEMSIPDRATVANMAPEYGASVGFFPVDENTLHYLRQTGRDEELIDLVERYCKEQALFRTAKSPTPEFSQVVELDLAQIEPSLAGPKRPQDRVPLSQIKRSFQEALSLPTRQGGYALADAAQKRKAIMPNMEELIELGHGAVVIAAITSCTNTSNPMVMVAAGLLAQKAAARGLKSKPYVKTSLAPGSRVVTEYLRQAGLLEPLAELGFDIVGYGCTTCIGNSGPLPAEVVRAIEQGDLVAAAVLSGNRNFEGRINPHVRANYLASPPLVVAYALAGTVDIDLLNQPLGYDQDGEAVFLRDLWPSQEETRRVVERTLDPQSFRQRYADVFTGNPTWNDIAVSEAELYRWDQSSTYIQEPPFFFELGAEGPPPADILGARTLALLGDSVTTDHISPAGAIPANSPAGSYLIERGVQPRDFNSFGSRRGNHHVMTRGTFGNIRLKNLLVPGIEGGVTIHLPSLEQMSVYQAATRYREEGVPLILVAGKEYGSGSSRDWAAKGTSLLGVRAVLAESYERIHRSNLIGMGVLPLEFVPGQNFETLGLSGYEAFDIKGIGEAMQTGAMLTVLATQQDGSTVEFEVRSRIDTSIEKDYYRNGGILHTVLQSMLPKP